MTTLYSNTRFEVTQSPAGNVFVTDHENEKTEAANAAQGATLRSMIEEICAEPEPEDATGLVEFLDDECYRIVYRDALIHEKITREIVARARIPAENLIVSIVR